MTKNRAVGVVQAALCEPPQWPASSRLLIWQLQECARKSYPQCMTKNFTESVQPVLDDTGGVIAWTCCHCSWILRPVNPQVSPTRETRSLFDGHDCKQQAVIMHSHASAA